MLSLNERLAIARTIQQSSKAALDAKILASVADIENNETHEEEKVTELDLVHRDYHELLPVIAKHWGYDTREIEYFQTEGMKPENIFGTLEMWRTDIIVYDIQVSPDLRERCMSQFAMASQQIPNKLATNTEVAKSEMLQIAEAFATEESKKPISQSNPMKPALFDKIKNLRSLRKP